jgi:hypothetical protein
MNSNPGLSAGLFVGSAGGCHPVIGYDSLKDNPAVTAELLDCVRHAGSVAQAE